MRIDLIPRFDSSLSFFISEYGSDIPRAVSSCVGSVEVASIRSWCPGRRLLHSTIQLVSAGALSAQKLLHKKTRPIISIQSYIFYITCTSHFSAQCRSHMKWARRRNHRAAPKYSPRTLHSLSFPKLSINKHGSLFSFLGRNQSSDKWSAKTRWAYYPNLITVQ